jgi:hypothetical protein
MRRGRSGWGELHHPVVVESEYQAAFLGSIFETSVQTD